MTDCGNNVINVSLTAGTGVGGITVGGAGGSGNYCNKAMQLNIALHSAIRTFVPVSILVISELSFIEVVPVISIISGKLGDIGSVKRITEYHKLVYVSIGLYPKITV